MGVSPSRRGGRLEPVAKKWRTRRAGRLGKAVDSAAADLKWRRTRRGGLRGGRLGEPADSERRWTRSGDGLGEAADF